MKLHTAGPKPDWALLQPNDRNFWQKLAARTDGIVSPGNFLSLAGLSLVIFGLFYLANDEYLLAAIWIGVGRLFDLLDGWAAELTKTKSPLGEIVDSFIDKIEVFAVLAVILLGSVIPEPVAVTAFLISLWISFAAIVARFRKLELHPSSWGKLTGGVCWVSLVFFIFERALSNDNAVLMWLAYGFFAIFLYLGILTAYQYSRVAAGAFPAAKNNLLRTFDNLFVIYNPKSSNAHRTERRINELEKLASTKPVVIKTGHSKQILINNLTGSLKKSKGKTLILVGGGDGTVHEVVNILMDKKNRSALARVVILPIWGGNANDLAYMTNGLSFGKKLAIIFSTGKILPVHPLLVKIKVNHKETIKYAICYVGLGATAYAAKQLNERSKEGATKFHSQALTVVARELSSVADAFKKAPHITAEINGKQVSIFEETFANGPRIAKLNTLPVKLTDKAYYHLHQSKKPPLFSARLLQIIAGRSDGKTKNISTEILLKESALIQLDGEVHELSKNTIVTIKIATQAIKVVSTKLPKEN